MGIFAIDCGKFFVAKERMKLKHESNRHDTSAHKNSVPRLHFNFQEVTNFLFPCCHLLLRFFNFQEATHFVFPSCHLLLRFLNLTHAHNVLMSHLQKPFRTIPIPIPNFSQCHPKNTPLMGLTRKGRVLGA